MEFTIEVVKLHEQSPKAGCKPAGYDPAGYDPAGYDPAGYEPDPEKALDIVEQLRLEAGKFLYEYPTPFRRTVEVVRRK